MPQEESQKVQTQDKRDQYNSLPGPKSLPLIGQGWNLMSKGCYFLSELEQKYGSMVKLPLPGIRGVLVNDYEQIQMILRQTERNYYKGQLYEMVKPITGNGLVTNQGESWRARRRTLNPLFKENAFNIEASFKKIETSLKKELLEQKDSDHTLIFSRTTFQILVQIFFSNMKTYDFEKLNHSFHQIQTYLGKIFWSPVRLPLWIPTPLARKTQKSLKFLHSHIEYLLKNSEKGSSENFINRLKHAKDPETGEFLTNKDISDELITFFIAGHDTTALTLTYTFYLLSKNKNALRQVQKEIDNLDQFSFENLKTCSYLKATLQESMRLLPAVYMINRNNKNWTTIGGYSFAPNTTFFISQYAIHRSKKYWKNPEEFEPSRFLNNPNPPGFFPFGDGPRTCIGNHLAFAEALMITGSILKNLEPIKGTESFKLSAYLTATPRSPIKLSWRKR